MNAVRRMLVVTGGLSGSPTDCEATSCRIPLRWCGSVLSSPLKSTSTVALPAGGTTKALACASGIVNSLSVPGARASWLTLQGEVPSLVTVTCALFEVFSGTLPKSSGLGEAKSSQPMVMVALSDTPSRLPVATATNVPVRSRGRSRLVAAKVTVTRTLSSPAIWRVGPCCRANSGSVLELSPNRTSQVASPSLVRTTVPLAVVPMGTSPKSTDGADAVRWQGASTAPSGTCAAPARAAEVRFDRSPARGP